LNTHKVEAIDYKPPPTLIIEMIKEYDYDAKYYSGEGGFFQADAFENGKVPINLKLDIQRGSFRMLGGYHIDDEIVGK
jgi:hypothetical protein